MDYDSPLYEVLLTARERAKEHDDYTSASAVDAIAKALKGAERAFVLADELAETFPDLDLTDRTRRMVWACEEFSRIREIRHRIRTVFRLSGWKAKGVMVVGSMAPVPTKEQDLHPNGPTWELTISLPAWLLMSEDQRDRLIHHELCHALPGDLGAHTIEEHALTLARFGPATAWQAQALAAALKRPTFIAEMRAFDFDERGQGCLFETARPDLRNASEREQDGERSSLRVVQRPPRRRSTDTADFIDACREVAQQAMVLPERCNDAGTWAEAARQMAEEVEGGAEVTPFLEGRLEGLQTAIAAWAS